MPLCTFSDCAVVCVRLMTCVPPAGFSDELWRFSTSTRVWERADSTAVNGAGPSARSNHVMTSVGLDLWVHGGSTGEGDTCDCCCCCSVTRSCSDCVCCGVLCIRLMCNTHGAASGPALRERVCLFAPSVTVCAVVYARLMTCVSHAEYLSAELWWFSTSTRRWDRADSTAVNDAGPSARSGHVMTSVGLDLWVHGGSTQTGEGNACATHVVLLLLPC
jgi:hypothetical protein